MTEIKTGIGTDEPDRYTELDRTIAEGMMRSAASQDMDLSLKSSDLVDLAVEVWRIEQRIVKSAAGIQEVQLKGLKNSLLKMRRFLEKNGLEIVDYKNTKYNEGLNCDILSIEKDSTLAEPQVKEVVEPAILSQGQVVRKAKIILLSNA